MVVVLLLLLFMPPKLPSLGCACTTTACACTTCTWPICTCKRPSPHIQHTTPMAKTKVKQKEEEENGKKKWNSKSACNVNTTILRRSPSFFTYISLAFLPRVSPLAEELSHSGAVVSIQLRSPSSPNKRPIRKLRSKCR